MRQLSIFVFLLAEIISLANPQTQGSASEKFLGLLEIPKVFGVVTPGGPPGQIPPAQKNTLLLHTEPNSKSAIHFRISKTEQLMTREHGYEEVSAMAYGQQKGWYLIRTKTGQGWLSPTDAGRFHAYEELLKESLIFLDTKTWNGHLYSSPDNLQRFEDIKSSSAQIDVDVIGQRLLQNRLWFEVQFIEGRCESEEKRGKKGWVPAHSEKGEPNLWFYSRGC